MVLGREYVIGILGGGVVGKERGLELGETEHVVLLAVPFNDGPGFDGSCERGSSRGRGGSDLCVGVEAFVGDGVPTRVLAFVY